jgi:hypothetical protein
LSFKASLIISPAFSVTSNMNSSLKKEICSSSLVRETYLKFITHSFPQC